MTTDPREISKDPFNPMSDREWRESQGYEEERKHRESLYEDKPHHKTKDEERECEKTLDMFIRFFSGENVVFTCPDIECDDEMTED